MPTPNATTNSRTPHTDHAPVTPAPATPTLAVQDNPDVTTTTTNISQSPRDENGVPNTQAVTVESTAGGIRIKLPTLVFAHVLSLVGVCGGAYTVTKPDNDQTKSDIAAIATRIERIERDRNAVVERLARIETLAENIREDLRDARGYGGRPLSVRRTPINRDSNQNNNGEQERP